MTSALGLYNSGLAQGHLFAKRAQMVTGMGLPPKPVAAMTPPAAAAPAAAPQPLAPDAFAARAAPLQTMPPAYDSRPLPAASPAPPAQLPFSTNTYERAPAPAAATPAAAAIASAPAGPLSPGPLPPAQHAPGSIGDVTMQEPAPSAGPSFFSGVIDNLAARPMWTAPVPGNGPPTRSGPRGLPPSSAAPTAGAVMDPSGAGRSGEGPPAQQPQQPGSMAPPPAWAQQYPGQMPAPPEWAQQYPGTEQVAVGSSAPPAPAAATAARPAPSAAPATAAPAAPVQAPPSRTPQAKPDDLVWSARGPGGRLMMVPRSALRPGEQSSPVTEGTIGAPRGLPARAAPAAAPAETTTAAPVTPVTTTELPNRTPRPKPGVATVPEGPAPATSGMGGPTARPTRGSRGASLATIEGGAGPDDLKGSSGGDQLKPGASMKTVDPVATDLPAHARAFLNGVAGGESGGRYDIRYTPKGGATFTGFDKHPGIMEKGPHGPSSAAGRYQFTRTTWKGLMGDAPFTPENQDRAAWKLGQQDYQKKTGRSLEADLQAEGLSPRIQKVLAPTWQAFLGNHGKHAGAYQSSMARYGAGGGTKPELMMSAADTPAADAPAPAAEREPAAAETKAADRRKEIADTLTSAVGSMAGGGGGSGGSSQPMAAMDQPAPGVQQITAAPVDQSATAPVEMAGARAIAERGLPKSDKPSASKSNTWAALRASLEKKAS